MQVLPKAILLLLAFTLALSGCDGPRNGLTVFAAASLTDVLESLGSEFTETSGIPVRFSFGGSITLAQQIANGAPADLFIAAGAAPMDTLETRGLLAHGTRRTLLTNSLVLAARIDGPELHQPRDLLSDHITRVAIADPALAPAGQYARTALQNLGLWEALQPKLVPSLDVRTSLAYLQRGEADVAVVYRTDAIPRDDVRILFSLPLGAHLEVEYPIALLRDTPRQEAALAFIAFLQSPPSRGVFQAQGWSTPDGAGSTPADADTATAAPRSPGQ